MIRRFGGRDKTVRPDGSSSLTTVEEAMLRVVMNAFVRGLSDDAIRMSIFPALDQPNQSIRGLFQCADQARWALVELVKYKEQEDKSRQLSYRELSEKTFSTHNIESMKAAYRSGKPRDLPSTPNTNFNPTMQQISFRSSSHTHHRLLLQHWSRSTLPIF